MQLDEALIAACFKSGLRVHVETNGTIDWVPDFPVFKPHWVTVSPKLEAGRLKATRASEIKLVVPDYHPDDYDEWADRCLIEHRWVQPEDGPRFKEACHTAMAVVEKMEDWRISVQAHKVVGAP